METILTVSQFNEFCENVDKIKQKGYDLAFEADRNSDGNFSIKLIGTHNLETLDALLESA